MGTEKEIEIELPNIFKNMTPTKMFGIVLVLAVILIATFYFTSSRAQEAALGQQGPPSQGILPQGSSAKDLSQGQAAQDQQVTLYVLNDEACIICTTGEMLMTLRGLFTNLNEVQVDYSSPEGKALAEKSKVISVPAYILDRSVENSVAFSQLRPYLFDMGDYYVARVLGSKLINNEEIPNRLDLFVMPTEPNSITFEFTIKDFLDSYSPGFSLYFVAHLENGTIVSVVDEEDVQEGIRQACAMKHEPDLFDYILCRNSDMTADWAECAANPVEMRECSEGEEGIELMKANLEESNALGVGASPTLIINNQLILLGNQPFEAIELVYCGANPGTCSLEETE